MRLLEAANPRGSVWRHVRLPPYTRVSIPLTGAWIGRMWVVQSQSTLDRLQRQN